ncbi:MAG TPA: hypothetical protein VGK64_29370 [Bryobacteraceae bacterium]
MSEAEETGAGTKRPTPEIDTICDCIRKGLEVIADTITPPESASKHFREARIEMLRGFRELIDCRIEHLSRKSTGTRVVVE